MNIGNYQIHSLETGTFALDGGAMFGVVPKVLWERTNPSDELNRIDMNLRVLLIIGEGRKILVDTGIGDTYKKRFKKIYKIDHSTYNLSNSLNKYGLTYDDITDVIITHLHFDHAGGATILHDDELKPAFQEATYYIQQKNLEHALKPNEKDRASYLQENFTPLIEQKKLRALQGAGELFPGIELLVTNGHTISQQLVRITDGLNTILYCADLIPTSSHIPIPYVMGYDLYPVTTIDEKKKILAEAVENDWILVYEHDAFVGSSKVKVTEKGFTAGEKITL